MLTIGDFNNFWVFLGHPVLNKTLFVCCIPMGINNAQKKTGHTKKANY